MNAIGFGLTLIVIIALLAISAFFSGSETALTAASRARLHKLAEVGSRRAKIAQRLTENRERLIGAILLGNNLVNILASALATSVFLVMFGNTGIVYATLVMTALVLIFAEVLPKTYAITNAERMSLAVAPLLNVLISLFAPVTAAIQFIVRHTLRLFGVDIENTREVLSAHEELRGAIDLHHHEGSVVKTDRDMLGGILDLQDLEVQEVMVHRKNMTMADASLPPQEIVDQILASPHTRIPLWKDNPENIIGIMHVKDLLRPLTATKGDISSLDILSIAAPPWFVPENTGLQDQLNAFLQRNSHFALVVDEYGALMGLITLEDILEEIVGEISDEHDIETPGLNIKRDGTVIAEGTVTIRDLNRTMEWSLPDEEATTIAGLVIHEAQTIPDVGQIFTFYNYKFEIIGRQRNQITALRITQSAKKKRH